MMEAIPAFQAADDLVRLMREMHERDRRFKIIGRDYKAVLISEHEWQRIEAERNMLYCACVRKFVREHVELSEEEMGWMADYVGTEEDVVAFMEEWLAQSADQAVKEKPRG